MAAVVPLRRAFVGVTLPGAGLAGSVAGQAHFDGCLAMAAWPRAVVEALLPPELQLAPRALAADDAAATHPILVVFGEHTDSAMVVAGLLVPAQLRYWEFCLAIPYVTHRRGRILHTYVPRMFSSYAPVVWDGNARFGLAKQLAEMGWDGPQFIVTGADGGLLWHASVEPRAPWSRQPTPDLAPLAEALALPIAGRRHIGDWRSTHFRFDFREALTRPTHASLSFDTALLPTLAPRLDHALPGAAVLVQGMLWRLTHPGPCHW